MPSDGSIPSTGTQIKRLQGCVGTGDLTAWEEGFIESLAAKAQAGQVTHISGKALEILERLFAKHFGDHA